MQKFQLQSASKSDIGLKIYLIRNNLPTHSTFPTNWTSTWLWKAYDLEIASCWSSLILKLSRNNVQLSWCPFLYQCSIFKTMKNLFGALVWISINDIAKLSPSPSPSWAELVITLAFPATQPATGLLIHLATHPEKSKTASKQHDLQNKSCFYQWVGSKIVLNSNPTCNGAHLNLI